MASPGVRWTAIVLTTANKDWTYAFQKGVYFFLLSVRCNHKQLNYCVLVGFKIDFISQELENKNDFKDRQDTDTSIYIMSDIPHKSS